ncbi:MAG: TolC family protein [Candidatus Aminicenantes bacterium]|nr:TolC family protein [Candidatus Aminicenantes bacterium]
MKKRALLGAALAVVVVAATTMTAQAQETMTLKEAAGLILANNQQVQIAAEAVTGAEFKIGESKSQYLPQVSVAGSYTRMSLFGEFSIPFNGTMYTVKFGTPNNYNIRASVMEQVFNWGRTARTVEISRAGLELASDGVALTKHLMAYQAVPLFYGTLYFREAVKVLDESIAAFENKLGTARARYDAGLASSFDINLLEVQISALRAQRLDFLASIDKFRIAFNTLAGRDTDAAFQPAAEFVFQPGEFVGGALTKEALSNRVEFRQWRHQIDLNQASVALAKTGDKPTVAASFNYEFRNGFMPDIEKIRGNWTALLSLNYPVFDGYRVRAQVAAAASALRSVELRKTDLERSVTMEIETALTDLRTYEAKWPLESLKIKQAEDALRIAEERFRNGLLSATDLVDAQNAVESARLGRLQLVYNHTLSQYNLYRSCGRTL